MDKETKKPDVVIGKSALDEFLEEWSSWRGKRNGKKIAATIRRRQAEENMPTAERIKMKRKRQRTNFMDSGFMVVIGFFVGLVEFFFSIVMWLFSFVFSFKFWAIVGVIIYFSDVEIEDIGKVLDDLNVKEAIEKVEEGAKGIMEQLDGLEFEIKQSDGTVYRFGDDVDEWEHKLKEQDDDDDT